MNPVSPPSPENPPGAGASEDGPRPALPLYASAHPASPERDARLAWHLRLAAGLMVVLALLVSWGLFDLFVIVWRRPWYSEFIQGRLREWRGPFEPTFQWMHLTRVLPPLVILLIFAGIYLLLARLVARGNREALTAASLVAMVHTLVAALWLLTVLVFGLNEIKNARAWWEQVPAIAGVVVSVAAVPWLMVLTFILLNGGHRRT